MNKNLLSEAVAVVAAYEPVQKHKVTPVYRCGLIKIFCIWIRFTMLQQHMNTKT